MPKRSPVSLQILRVILRTLAFAGIAASAHAQNTFIKADNTADLNTAASYTANSGVPGAADTIQIDSTLTAARTALLGASLSVHAISVPTNYAQRFTFGSTTGATLTIGAGGIAKTNTSVAMNLGCSVAVGANQTWNIAGNNLVFNGPNPIISTNGFNLLVTGNGTFDVRPATGFACGANMTINCTQVNINATGSDVTFGGANTFKNLLIANGTAEGSTFPADTNATTTSHFGNASSGSITFGANSSASATLIYNGNTASTPKTFTYDARSTGTATINVSNSGETLTLTSTPLLSNGAAQTSDKNWNFGGAGNLTVNGPINNASGSSFKIGINKSDAGTLTLRGANTFTGDAIINGGTLAVSGSGTLAGAATIVVSGGATLDVSGMSSAFSLGASQTLSNRDSATGALKGNINASGGKLAMTFNGGTPAFTIGSGTLTLSGSTVVQVAGAFAVGVYHLITPAAGGSVAGTLPPVLLFRSTGHLQFSAGGLDLVVDSADPFHYYIAPTGSDITGDGTPGTPWQSIMKVRDFLRTLGPLTGDITVYLRGGRYEIANTLSFTTADSGTNGHIITYQSYPGERATISGGKRVTGWTQVPGQPYWVASVSTSSGFADYFRTLFVNGVRAERAHSGWITGSAYFDDPATTTQTVDGIAFATTAGLKTYTNVGDVRLLHTKYFKIDECPITGIVTDSGTGLIDVQLQQPYCQYRYDYGAGYFDATSPWMVVNAFEELDEPGEFYLNRTTQQVYYYPGSFEDMTIAIVYVPIVEKLVDLSGDSSTSKVQNLRFQGIVFEHSNWLFPRDYFVGGASGDVLLKAAPPTGSTYYDYEIPGAIKLKNASGIQFIGNTIQRQSTSGIHLYEGVDDTLIQGNTFVDLTGAAVLQGHAFNYIDICTNTTVVDNVMRHTGADFWGGSIVDNLGGYNTKVLRNDMADCAYSGFNQGNSVSTLAANTSGHGATEVGWNRVTLAQTGARYEVGDGASIYTAGVWPNTSIHDNDVSDILEFGAISNNVHGFYQDDGSYGITWQDNVVRDVTGGIWGCFWVRKDIVDPNVNKAINTYSDSSTIITSGLASNTGYTPFTLGSTPPAAAQAIIQAAGVGRSYTGLLDRIYSGKNLARGKSTSASSTSGFSSGAAVDWNIRTPWRSAAGDTSAAWSVDLGSAYVLQRIEIMPRIDQNDAVVRNSFQVLASNSASFATFTVIAEQGSVPYPFKQTNLRNSWIKYINNPNGYRYLRVKKTNSAALGIEEFRAFGYAAPTAPSTFTWDAGATGSITDGSGGWNAPDQWWNGSANQNWADNNDAIIGNGSGAAGSITVSGASPQVNSLTFNAATSGSYLLSGTALQLNGAGLTTIVTANAPATVNNSVSTTGAFVKAGAAPLTLSGASTFAGDVTVAAGVLSLSNPSLTAGSVVTLSADVALNLNFTGVKSITALRINGLVQAPGVWGSLSSSATNKSALITGSGHLNVTGSQPPYDAWALAGGLDNSSASKDATLTADADRDGTPNLMEYATRMNPTLNDTVTQSATKSGSILYFVYTQNKAATDVTYIVEWSDTLLNDWSNVGVSAPTILGDNGATQQIQVTVPAGLNGRRFARLRVTKP